MSQAQATTQWEELREAATASGVLSRSVGPEPAVSHTQALPMTCQSRSSPTSDLSVPPTSPAHDLSLTLTGPTSTGHSH